MRQHHNAIRNWYNITNNSVSAESKIKTLVPTQQETQPSVIEEKPIEKIKPVVEESVQTIEPITTVDNKSITDKKLPDFTNKKNNL